MSKTLNDQYGYYDQWQEERNKDLEFLNDIYEDDWDDVLDQLVVENQTDKYLLGIRKTADRIINKGGDHKTHRLYLRNLKPRQNKISTTLEQIQNLWTYYLDQVPESEPDKAKKWIKSSIIIFLVSESDYYYLKDKENLEDELIRVSKGRNIIFPEHGWFYKPEVPVPMVELLKNKDKIINEPK